MTDTKRAREVIIPRLDKIVKAIVAGDRSELTMRVPADLDRDADLIISEAAALLRALSDEVEELRAVYDQVHEELACCMCSSNPADIAQHVRQAERLLRGESMSEQTDDGEAPGTAPGDMT